MSLVHTKCHFRYASLYLVPNVTQELFTCVQVRVVSRIKSSICECCKVDDLRKKIRKERGWLEEKQKYFLLLKNYEGSNFLISRKVRTFFLNLFTFWHTVLNH